MTAKAAFSARIRPWINERYTDGPEQADGRYVVTFKVTDPASWLVRKMLQYGAEVEVLEPEGVGEAWHDLRNKVMSESLGVIADVGSNDVPNTGGLFGGAVSKKKT